MHHTLATYLDLIFLQFKRYNLSNFLFNTVYHCIKIMFYFLQRYHEREREISKEVAQFNLSTSEKIKMEKAPGHEFHVSVLSSFLSKFVCLYVLLVL